MSLRVDTTPLITNSFIVGDTGLGVLAEDVPSDGESGPGYLYNDLSFPDDTGKEVRGEIVTWPVEGTLVANEDSSLTFTAPNGEYFFEYQLYEDGVAIGTPATVTLIIGQEIVAVISERQSQSESGEIVSNRVVEILSRNSQTESSSGTSSVILDGDSTQSQSDTGLVSISLSCQVTESNSQRSIGFASLGVVSDGRIKDKQSQLEVSSGSLNISSSGENKQDQKDSISSTLNTVSIGFISERQSQLDSGQVDTEITSKGNISEKQSQKELGLIEISINGEVSSTQSQESGGSINLQVFGDIYEIQQSKDEITAFYDIKMGTGQGTISIRVLGQGSLTIK